MAASTQWREQVGADEAERFEQYRQIMAGIQKKNSEQFGAGRGLHRKSNLALTARVEVLDGLPAYARQGLFARPGEYEAWLRLSNGSPAVQSDKVKDVRGFAIKVRGVRGEGALGAPTDCQDFLLIHLPAFAFATPDEFMGLVQARFTGKVLPYFLKRYGVLGTLRQMKRLGSLMKQPFRGFAATPFFSAAPFACGPYAVRMRLQPALGSAPPPSEDLGVDLLAQLASGPLRFDLQLQFFVDEARTPIEDASVDWPDAVAPYLTVARLHIAPEAAASARDEAFIKAVEAESFDPWRALAAHRPLGAVMRTRKVIYFDSAQNRKPS